MMFADDVWHAAKRGDLPAVRRFIKAEDLPPTNKRGDSLLTVACGAGNVNLVSYLLGIGADIGPNGVWYSDPQHAPHAFEAMRNGHLEIIRLLCEEGWELEKHTVEHKHGLNLIDDAVRHRQVEITRYLLEQGHEIYLPIVLEFEGRECPTDTGEREEPLAIEQAARAGAADLVLFLSEVGVEMGEHPFDFYYQRALLGAANRLNQSEFEQKQCVETEEAERERRIEAKGAKRRERIETARLNRQALRDEKITWKVYLGLTLGWTCIYFVGQIARVIWHWIGARL